MRWLELIACVAVAGCDPSSGLIGTPCIPAQESDPTFLGFDPQEVTIEATSVDRQTPNAIVCLVNHFRGRATCRFGQDVTGTALPQVGGALGGPFPADVAPCKTPSGDPVVGDLTIDPVDGAQVWPQCTDRRAADTVIWSCRCANADGKSDESTCSCPNGTTCTELVNPIGEAIVGLSLFYCITAGHAYDWQLSCGTSCDPSTATCKPTTR